MSPKKLRKDALAIFHAGVKAVDPVIAVKQHFRVEDGILSVDNRTYDLTNYKGVYVVGAGKASAAMAQPMEEILGDRIKASAVNVKYGHDVPLKIIRVNEAGHPVPDEAGLKGTKQIIQLLQQTGDKDLVIFLISGGGSALLPCPAQGLTLENKQKVTKHLLEVGATIHEINAVRKHISQVKGGQLARLVYPSALISLILSDVIGDNLDSIASGPTVPDSSTFSDCLHILDKYNIKKKIPAGVLEHLERGAKGEIKETPKAGDPVFKKTQNAIIGSNILAVKAAREKAQELKYHTMVLSSYIEGETREVAKVHTAVAKEILSTSSPVSRPACVISGGETTVTIRGKGLGGRNQEFVLAAAIDIDGLEDVVILSGGTDGTDGPTDAAGALADGETVRRAKKLGLDAEYHLRENDSYHFFLPLGDLLITGPTYTNVMDLRFVIVG
jgi:hydroxypyruvate reductase